jgi:hypothetical protein
MKPFDWRLTRDDGELVLATAEEVMDGLDMKLADFRDTHALYYLPFRAWVGLSRSGIELGTGTPRMEGGLWYVRRDDVLCAANQEVEPDLSLMVLRRIG